MSQEEEQAQDAERALARQTRLATQAMQSCSDLRMLLANALAAHADIVAGMQASAAADAQAAQARLDCAQNHAAAAAKAAQAWQATMQNSTSWRLTAPIRKAGEMRKRLRHAIAGLFPPRGAGEPLKAAPEIPLAQAGEDVADDHSHHDDVPAVEGAPVRGLSPAEMRIARQITDALPRSAGLLED